MAQLILAPIRTKLGNVVLRRVRPDNPNIVRELVVQPPEEAPVVEERPKTYEAFLGSVLGCCGATYYRQESLKKPVLPEAEIRAMYDRGVGGYKAQWLYYNQQGVNYAQHATRYSFERFMKDRIWTRNTQGNIPASRLTSPGVLICPDPFPGYTVKSPGGMYLKRCYDLPGGVKKLETLPPSKVLKLPPHPKGPQHMSGSYPFVDDQTVYLVSGMEGRTQCGRSILELCENQKVVAGTRVLALFNNIQRDSDGRATATAMANAGFTEVLQTGNSQHYSTSILYIYERTIQEGDYDALKS